MTRSASAVHLPPSRIAGRAGSVAAAASCFVAAIFCGVPRAAVPSTVHPNWSVVAIRPSSFQPLVTGMGFLPDGRLAISHWGGVHSLIHTRQFGGRVYILSGVTGNTPSPVVQTFADSLEDPMGLVVVDDTVFVSGGNRIVKLASTNGGATANVRQTVFTLPGKPVSGNDSLNSQRGRHEFLFGLLHKEGTFYLASSSAKLTDGSDPDDNQLNPHRGMAFAVSRQTGQFQILSMGLRNPNGPGWGPNGEIFIPDVQGNWLPANKLIHIQPGKFFGFHHTPAEAWEPLGETPAAVYMPQTEMAAAPGNPLYVPDGIYAGQFLMGDVRYGGIQRYFLEKVNGNYQGAAFNFTGGLEAGVERLAWGPDGMLYAGGGGGTNGNWHWTNKYFGLQKLRYNPAGDTVFEMLAVRARPAGMEIEFTRPVDTAIARLTSTYTVQSRYFVPRKNYGCVTSPTSNCPSQTALTIQSVQVSPDRRKVYLALAGLQPATPAQPQRVIRIGLNNMRSAANQTAWTTETFYTLNALGAGNPFDPPAPINVRIQRDRFVGAMPWTFRGGALEVRVPFEGSHRLRLLDVRGGVIASVKGHGAGWRRLDPAGNRGKIAILEVVGEAGPGLREMVVFP